VFEVDPSLFLLPASGHASLPAAMLLVFGAAKLFSEILEALGQPGIVGEIIAGAVIGPSVLNLVHPNEVLSTLAELGVMFLLFRVGLEVKASDLMRVGGVAALVAALGIIAPFLCGWGIMLAFGTPNTEAIFVGAAMVATSVGITAQVLEAKGLLQVKASRVILAAAVIDDVLGLIVLALVSSLARGEVNVPGLIGTAVAAIGFTVIIAVFGRHTIGRVVPKIEERLSAAEAQFTLALVLMFGLSLAAVYAGVAAIIGAFLAGMALSETVGERVHELTTGVSELLVPFFLAGIGLNLDIGVFENRTTLLLSGVIVIAAVASKLVGCGLGAISLGWADMLRVGSGMVPRGEVGMVVAQLGLSLGVVAEPVYAVVVVMAVATTLVAPPMLKATFKGIQQGKAEEQFDLG
jgi:Kef-type K+ transport system membrane component KefB